MLFEIRAYLAQRRVASLHDLAVHFQLEADTLRGMLQHWIRKGKVRKHGSCGTCASGCGGCGATLTEFYEWVAMS